MYNRSGSATNTQRVVCNTAIEEERQVTFTHISDKHPNKELVAVIGTGRKLNEPSGPLDEIYLLQPTAKTTRAQYLLSDTGVLCGSNHIERYHLPVGIGPSGGLDIVRFSGLQFKDKKN